MNIEYKIRNISTVILVIATAIFINLIYSQIAGITSSVWRVYGYYSLADFIFPVCLFISAFSIMRGHNWGKWLYAGYAMTGIFFSIGVSLEHNLMQYTFMRPEMLSSVVFVILFIFFLISIKVLFSKEASRFFGDKSLNVNEIGKRPLLLTIASICSFILAIYWGASVLSEHYIIDGFFFLRPFSFFFGVFSSYVLMLVLSIGFFLGKKWARTLYMVRGIAFFFWLLMDFLELAKNNPFNEIQDQFDLLLSHFIVLFIYLYVLYNKKSNEYFH
ncbi:hypothetical protein [Aggregatibacter segnis]|uniref:hypothetical protein n=1 Tax=Aggregatibacter segnis TaxID=739 RepID=UPI00288C3CE3|nr:hypothetical protein [Aggregatibacter segnis]